MAKTLEEALAALAALEAKVQEDVDQTGQLVVVTNKLVEYIKSLPTQVPVDYQPFVDAADAITAKLTADNPAIQAAIDSGVVPTTPTNP